MKSSMFVVSTPEYAACPDLLGTLGTLVQSAVPESQNLWVRFDLGVSRQDGLSAWLWKLAHCCVHSRRNSPVDQTCPQIEI